MNQQTNNLEVARKALIHILQDPKTKWDQYYASPGYYTTIDDPEVLENQKVSVRFFEKDGKFQISLDINGWWIFELGLGELFLLLLQDNNLTRKLEASEDKNV